MCNLCLIRKYFVSKFNYFIIVKVIDGYKICTGICETGYKGDNCDQCDTGYYGDGSTCTTCGTHKTTPASGTAATATDCKILLIAISK